MPGGGLGKLQPMENIWPATSFLIAKGQIFTFSVVFWVFFMLLLNIVKVRKAVVIPQQG